MSSVITPANLTERYTQLDHGPLRSDIYYKPDIFNLEMEKIFRPSWHCVGRVEELKGPGSFFTRDLATFKMSILVCRGDDGEIRSFLNACPHRGNQVELENCGRRGSFTCKFHAWRYDLRGQLVHVPDSEGFPTLDQSSIGLKQLTCDIWEGFIFINLYQEPAESLAAYMGQQGADLAGYPFEAGTTQFKYVGDVDTNWKFLVDSFCETYHVPYLHQHTIKSTMSGPANPYGRVVDVRLKGKHRTTSVWGNREWQPAPLQTLALNNMPGLSITSAGGGDMTLPKGLNETRSPYWAIDVTVFFPGFICVIGPGMYFTHQMWPLAVNRTRWEMTGYLRPARNAAERFGQEHAMVELRDAVLEDANTLERMQRNYATGMMDHIHFHDHELSLRYQHHTVCEILGLEA